MDYFEALRILLEDPKNKEAQEVYKRDKGMVTQLLDEVFQGKEENRNWI